MDRSPRAIYDINDWLDKVQHGEPVVPTRTDISRGSIISKLDIRREKDADHRHELYRIRREQSRAAFGKADQRNINHAMSKLRVISDKLYTPNFLQMEAAIIYRRLMAENLIRGRTINTMVAACVYAAYRIHGERITLPLIAKVSGEVKGDIARSYRLIHTELNLKVSRPDASRHIEKLCSKIDVPMRINRRAIEIIEELKAIKLTGGKSPLGIAAAVLYIVTREDPDVTVTQREIAAAANITEVTIRNRYKEIKEYYERGGEVR